MQTDMHYYGTYAMARAAGLKPDVCEEIASFAQFVDDNATDETIDTKNGVILHLVATAHHTSQVVNLNKDNQRYVWVPFHFLPGNEGSSYTERLQCRKDSHIAREMVEHHLSLSDKPYAVALMGITAHVYADTFSHYGFSGVSSRRNRVIQDGIELYDLSNDIYMYVTNKAKAYWQQNGSQGGLLENFREKVHLENKEEWDKVLHGGVFEWLKRLLHVAGERAVASFAEAASGALGHGPVHTYPDRPFLAWKYQYEVSGEKIPRNNHADFVDACHALHRMFLRFAELRPDLRADGGIDGSRLDEAVRDILALQAGMEGRIDKWQSAANRGDIYASGAEPIPIYDENIWLQKRDKLSLNEDPDMILEASVFRFYQAAAVHRTYVLRDLLPQHGLLVS